MDARGRHTGWLIGAGSSICGGFGGGTGDRTGGKAETCKVTVAVATVVIFGTIAIFLYPAMASLLALVQPGNLASYRAQPYMRGQRKWSQRVMR
ncbi:putative sulfate exporter family transporter [Salmonella enterica subsp. enterica]|nr:putative sulfate exporter family transporter [Salmonella enterica subsp. enterica]